jgi:hypothetical protein
MPASSPQAKTIERVVPATATGADAELDLTVVSEAGTVTAVTYTPSTVLTGADTNSRTVVLVNKGAAGSGTTIVATKAYTNGVNAAADVPNAVTLSGTAANLVVAAGDVLVWQSTHVGTGLADPGGLVHIEITRGDVSS